MAKEIFNRYEHKYLLDGKTFKQVTEIMEKHMELDAYNINRKPYTISNIYYDTPDDYLVRKSLSKPVYKEKLRLRSYGVPKEDGRVFLEIKKKFGGIVNKRRTALELEEAYGFIKSGKAPEKREYMNFQVVREIEYFLSHYDLCPKVYIAYDRIAYFEKGNPDLRISFDFHIRTRRYELGLEKGDFGRNLLPAGVYLMEIKTSLAKPLWVCDMLSELNIKRSSFSKYGTEFKQMTAENSVFEEAAV